MMHEKIKELCCLKETLVSWVKSETAKGVHQVNTKELGEVIDMIKDLAEAEKCCMEAHYYMTVSDAMEEYGDEMMDDMEERYGYNPMHSSQTGRFISRGGRGRRGRGGYTPNSGGSGNSGSRGGNEGGRDGSNGRMGYVEPDWDEDMYGRDRHREKRWYHEPTNENVGEVMMDLETMWNNADPETKRRLKGGMNELIGKMKI